MATYIRLTDYKSSDEKEKGFFDPKNRYEAKQEDFEKIPGSPIAYWVSEKFKQLIVNKKIVSLAFSDGKNVTGSNDIFLKQLWEVNHENIGLNKKWLFMMKGGEYRKWYGNIDYIIDWDENARLHYRKSKIGRLIPEYLWYKKGITWSKISSKNASFRTLPEICTFDEVNITLRSKDEYNYTFSYLNSKVGKYFLDTTNQTLSFQTENILSLPIIFPKSPETKQKIDQLAQQNIDISKEEWDSRETSWDFQANPLLEMLNAECSMLNEKKPTLETIYNRFCSYWSEKFFTLHKNEEELNRLFIEIYELQDELTPEVELKDITILKNEAKIIDGELVFQADEIMKQFISYGVGVMFGRYSLDHKGLHVANMNESIEECNAKFNIQNSTFEADDDNIIPVLEDDYFKDDITSRFVQFVKVTFGEVNLSENLRFIENSLGTTLRKYFVKGFYEDHIKRYKKRPIYWMVASPKKGFMSLIYMHRYETDTFARVRNSYLTEYIAKLEAHKETLHLTTSSETASSKDKKDADKEIKKIENKLKELIAFDREKIMHFAQKSIEIDLDDGVKVNYCKFRDILYPITGLCK